MISDLGLRALGLEGLRCVRGRVAALQPKQQKHQPCLGGAKASTPQALIPRDASLSPQTLLYESSWQVAGSLHQVPVLPVADTHTHTHKRELENGTESWASAGTLDLQTLQASQSPPSPKVIQIPDQRVLESLLTKTGSHVKKMSPHLSATP